jgi:hypothetical protein
VKVMGEEGDVLFRGEKEHHFVGPSPARPSDKGRVKVETLGWLEAVA